MTDRKGALGAVASAKRALERARRQEATAHARFEAAIVKAAQAGASQREIAARAGVSQPYVSQVVTANRGRFVPSSKLGYLLAAHRDEVLDIVRRFGAGNVVVFGSVARGEDGPGSDIDLAADIPDDMGLLTLSKMEQAVRDALRVPVDMTPSRLLKPAVRRTVEPTAVPL